MTDPGFFLRPDPTAPLLEGDELEDFLQLSLVGITGLDPKLVRPRYQPNPPTQPGVNVTWLAFGINRQTPDANAFLKQSNDIDGVAQYMQRQETIELFTVSYGPNSKAVLAGLRDGISIEQNRELLRTQKIAIARTGEIVRTSELMNQQYIMRHDMLITLRRQIERVYSVPNIKSAQGTVKTENFTVTFDTTKEIIP